MGWKPDHGLPICPQICEQMCVRVANGNLQPHAKLVSVRELAVMLGVNPNTVQRSYEQLEQQGVLYSVPGTGWYVSEDAAVAKNAVENLRRERPASFFAEMENLGLDLEAAKQYVKEWEA